MEIGLLGILASLCAFILGMTVYLKDKSRPINISFAIFSLTAATWSLSLYFYANPIFFPALTWIKIVYLLCFPLVSSSFYFSFVFPDGKTKQANKCQVVYYLIAAIFIYFLLFTNKWVLEVSRTAWGYETWLGPVYKYWGLFNLTIGGWIFKNFYKKYKTSKGLIHLQLKYVFLGIFIMATGTLVLDVLVPVLTGSSRYFWASSLFLLPFIASTSYAIIKHRLMDIHLVIARSVAYSLLVVILGVFYSAGLFIASTFLIKQPTTTGNLAISTFLALIIAFSFQPLRRFLEKITDQIFYKERYDPQDLLGELSQIMASTLNLKTLTHKVLDTLCEEMNLSKGSFLILRKGEIYVSESSDSQDHTHLAKEELKKLDQRRKLLVFEELKEGKIKEIFRRERISVCLPLETKAHLVGFLLLGEKSAGDIYFEQDLETLEILGPQLAIALENAQRFDQIRKFSITLQEEVKKATQSLRQANRKLKELDKLKDEFVSVASHELRTPMAAIKGYLWMVLNKDRGLSLKVQERVKRAYNSTERLIALVNDMLNVSRIESGRMKLMLDRINLTQLASGVKEELATKAAEKKIKIAVKADKDYWVKADEDRIHQVFINIMDNALKFTPEKGSVTVSIQEKNNEVITSITDTGIGIKKEDIPRLFTKFGRLDGSLTSISETPGTGLGLYICKKIIELSGGKIWAESQVGKGSTFHFSLSQPSASNET